MICRDLNKIWQTYCILFHSLPLNEVLQPYYTLFASDNKRLIISASGQRLQTTTSSLVQESTSTPTPPPFHPITLWVCGLMAIYLI